MFIDYVEIEVSGGKGGPGCISFLREKYIEKGGPNGGDGGRGGDIIFVADPNLTTLMDFRYRRIYKAKNGRPGEGSNKSGKSADPIIIRVPTGTIIKNMETEQIIVDMGKNGQREVIAIGGDGGRGNTKFKSPINQAPRRADTGKPGEGFKLGLELKLLADVGLVGLPNAGKSTLLSRVSAARPKIANYPFTTLVPNLGIVRLGEFRSFVMADIPGIIEGASDGKGLGIQFLKHIQRTGLILYMVDVTTSDIEETLGTLKEELSNFDPSLTKRPFLIAINKIDLLSDEELLVISKKLDKSYILLSAVSGKGEKELLNRIEDELNANRK